MTAWRLPGGAAPSQLKVSPIRWMYAGQHSGCSGPLPGQPSCPAAPAAVAAAASPCLHRQTALLSIAWPAGLGHWFVAHAHAVAPTPPRSRHAACLCRLGVSGVSVSSVQCHCNSIQSISVQCDSITAAVTSHVTRCPSGGSWLMRLLRLPAKNPARSPPILPRRLACAYACSYSSTAVGRGLRLTPLKQHGALALVLFLSPA